MELYGAFRCSEGGSGRDGQELHKGKLALSLLSDALTKYLVVTSHAWLTTTLADRGLPRRLEKLGNH
jgi:hypothetical protein